jgi:small subunit ribosomal protein S20
LEESDVQTKGSARKRHRQSLKRRATNKATKTRIRSTVRKLQEAVEAKNAAASQDLLKKCSSVLDSAASSGVIGRNTAARKKRRLAKLTAGMSAT